MKTTKSINFHVHFWCDVWFYLVCVYVYFSYCHWHTMRILKLHALLFLPTQSLLSLCVCVFSVAWKCVIHTTWHKITNHQYCRLLSNHISKFILMNATSLWSNIYRNIGTQNFYVTSYSDYATEWAFQNRFVLRK